ncbi:hypothetical protein AKJ09_07430 [Labilithrix luteola]|uniref:Uncharacterized protein n=1 Tax=Labilithrix luteola TaxID=1391654 RepID=A0A0K1Q541_9BACT|nr:hypothetical protein [Labilithrix luteola]AKV00767.1 hypothetical protein AKJ09_07430 [Labilithrix luteola]
MKVGRAIMFGIVGAAAMSLLSAILRMIGIPIYMEMILGSLTGIVPGPTAFLVGLLIHLAIGAIFGVIYCALFENVWDHGGAGTGMILSVIHAALLGMIFGLTPQFHPYIPRLIHDPGPYFANGGPLTVIAFFGIHLVYGAIVGAGYGHVVAEHQWAPEGRL